MYLVIGDVAGEQTKWLMWQPAWLVIQDDQDDFSGQGPSSPVSYISLKSLTNSYAFISSLIWVIYMSLESSQ